VASVPSINYGAFSSSSFKNFFRRLIFKLADKVICVSQTNLDDTLKNTGINREKCEIIYHGFTNPETKLLSFTKRKKQIVLLARANENTYRLKGIDWYLKLAEMTPEFDFLLLGQTDSYVDKEISNYSLDNFKALGFVEFKSKRFDSILDESKFVLMLSAYESFGCALMDGAVMGCYPVCFDRFGQKEVNLGVGSIVSYGDLEGIKAIISENEEKFDSLEISKRVLSKYPFSIRSEKIINIINNL
jgi:glycosyltransferase involved in cell wall biosynthesis